MASRQPAKRLPRPAARYWKGKAPKGADAALSESDEEEAVDEQEVQEEGDVSISDVGGEEEDEEEEEDGLEVRPAVGRQVKGAITVALKDVSVSRDGKVIVGGKAESGRTAVELEEGALLPFMIWNAVLTRGPFARGGRGRGGSCRGRGGSKCSLFCATYILTLNISLAKRNHHPKRNNLSCNSVLCLCPSMSSPSHRPVCPHSDKHPQKITGHRC